MKEKGFAAVWFILVALLVIAGVLVFFFVYKKSAPKAAKTSQETSESGSYLKEEYQNPFDEKDQSTNPFDSSDTYTNPFDSL